MEVSIKNSAIIVKMESIFQAISMIKLMLFKVNTKVMLIV